MSFKRVRENSEARKIDQNIKDFVFLGVRKVIFGQSSKVKKILFTFPYRKMGPGYYFILFIRLYFVVCVQTFTVITTFFLHNNGLLSILDHFTK